MSHGQGQGFRFKGPLLICERSWGLRGAPHCSSKAPGASLFPSLHGLCGQESPPALRADRDSQRPPPKEKLRAEGSPSLWPLAQGTCQPSGPP
uniref:Uncharacterized protein n=1 Tax=Rangifer tarandus platyrhynchus TaxID=3082113 RepID=A0ACB0EW10_RANTA|nr:unnamed protein product [Rangifer tarandus platyrhynchus]